MVTYLLNYRYYIFTVLADVVYNWLVGVLTPLASFAISCGVTIEKVKRAIKIYTRFLLFAFIVYNLNSKIDSGLTQLKMTFAEKYTIIFTILNHLSAKAILLKYIKFKNMMYQP